MDGQHRIIIRRLSGETGKFKSFLCAIYLIRCLFKDVWIWKNVLIYLRWLEFIAVLPRASHLISNILKYRHKVTNRGKTGVLSKPIKRRIRMGYTCMIYETKFKWT